MTKKVIILVIGLLISFVTIQAQSWQQIGVDIDGDAASDAFGWSVCLSADGNTVAIGVPYNDLGGNQTGLVRIYQINSGTWTQVGEDIYGEAVDNYFGSSVSLSFDGSIVAIGAYGNSGNGSNAGHVRIYQNNAGTWSQIGEDIEGETAQDFSGSSVSLSSDGSVVAIGAFRSGVNSTYYGQVRIFQNNAGTWTQVGEDIDGEAAGDYCGNTVSLSYDGSVVAIGAYENDGNGSNSGHVRIYQNIAGIWTQVGADINGEASGDKSGTSVSLSSDGSIVAIGAMYNDGNGSDSGQVRIYQNIAGTWTQIGEDIDGEATEDFSGESVSLSFDGSIVAIGAMYNDGNGSNSGHVRIYQNIAGTWTQVGADIDGEATGDKSGTSVSLNYNGSMIAIGAPGNDANASNAGHVRIYELSFLPAIVDQPENKVNICPNETITFAVTGVDIDSYQWQFNSGDGFENIVDDGVYSNTTTATLNITNVTSEMNNYQYRCFVENAHGNTTSNPAILTTDTENPATLTLADIETECSVSVYTPTTTDNCAGTITGTTTDPTEYTEQGTYTITWTFDDGNGNSIDVDQTVIVDDVTNPNISCIDDQVVDADETHFYTVQGTEFQPTETTDNCVVASVENDFNNTETLENAQLPEGTTTIIWTITDIAGNENTCSFDVTVNAYVGIETLQQKGISIYPNPTNGIVNFEFAKNNIQKIKISDITGKQIIEKNIMQQNDQIDLSGFESGIYIISIQTDNEIFTTKIIKE